jgi:tRNA dimethylallyltransferase
MVTPRAILLAGPTASGKSALALELARRIGGTVINADSMQVYRDLAVLTARPTAAEMAEAPHALYGHVDGAEAYSAGRFAAEAGAEIRSAIRDRRMPIVVGGTGLYFKALLEGLAPVPPVLPEIRAYWRAEAERLGGPALHKILAQRDPAMAGRLEPSDRQRIARALEVIDSTGHSLLAWQQKPGTPVVREQDTVRIVIDIAREELYRRCDARFERMLVGGAPEEVRALLSRRLDVELPVMRALGVEPIARMLAGEITREAAGERVKAETRQYAKRQQTWITSNMHSWTSLKLEEMESFIPTLLSFI